VTPKISKLRIKFQGIKTKKRILSCKKKKNKKVIIKRADTVRPTSYKERKGEPV
jgi:hypothetical protein